MYFVNDECFIIPDDENYILYAPLNRSILLINKQAVKILQDIKSGCYSPVDNHHAFISQMIKSGILFTDSSRQPKPSFPGSPDTFHPGGLSLFLTTKCNMRCIYCYSKGGERIKKMPWILAKAAMDFIINSCALQGRKSFYVSFHGGGEVTTAGSLMKRCVEYIYKNAGEMKPLFSGGFNGVIKADMLDWIIDNFNDATVSLDGLPEIQNMQRPLADGKESFDLVANTLRRMDERKFRYGVRATVTNTGLKKLPESVEFICRNFRTRTIQTEPFFLVGRAADNNLKPVDPAEFVKQFRKARERAARYGVRLKYSGSRFPLLTNIFCRACGESFVVTADGNISSCYEVSEPDDPRAPLFFYGRYNFSDGRFIIDKNKLKRLQKMNVENKPFCAKCFCKWHCAGDCPAKLSLAGDAWDPSYNDRCYINQELTKDQIKDFLFREEAGLIKA
jgi:uncharacterized protein